tara:strand:+ start:236 stop:466 length:231 start_codon:yes stop_codon:yes gene_type:complete
MNIFDQVMSPLGKEHCFIYYIFGIVALFSAIILLVSGVIQLFKKKELALFMILNSISYFATYYLVRITYSICLKAL